MSEEMSTAARETDLPHLTRAIALAASARRHGNHPFGSLLVDRDGSVVLEAENTVVTGRDVTAHAEQNLVREASARLPPHELEALVELIAPGAAEMRLLPGHAIP